jgi:predicted DNA-binding transcriptional regulator YafY
MADTSSRMLELLSLLQLHRFWSGTELADRLSVSSRTLRRDIERLRGLGYAIDSTPGVDGGYEMAAGTSLPPMVFTDDEAVALALGLRNVALGTDPGTAEASVRALAKLSAILPSAVRQQVDLLQHVTDGPVPSGYNTQPQTDVVGAVAQACADSVRLRFGYRARGVDAADDVDERYVEPYRLVTRGRRWYLVAFDLDRDDWRTFRLDRMSSPAPARNCFTPRPLPAADLSGYLAERISELRPQRTVEFDVALPVETVAARVGRHATVRTTRGGNTRVTMTVEELDWALFTALSLDAAIHAVTPEFAEHIEHRRLHLG